MSLDKDILLCTNLNNNSEYNKSELILSKYIEEDPKLSFFWNCLGTTLRGLGRLNESLECFKRAISELPNIGESYYNLGRLEGEAISFHRHQDILMSKYNKTILAPPDRIIYSCFNEQQIIQTLLKELPELTKYAVDIGASDGLTFSNTYKLFETG